MIDKARLLEKGAAAGLALAPVADALDAYARILVEYNEKVNLTAITQPAEIEDKHFMDCLLFAARPEVAGTLVDVGTGAGFPGVVAKIWKPELGLALMEPTGKRLDFLRFLCGELGIEAEFIKERAEEAARKSWREAFDVATARAVAPMAVLCEYCLPLVRPGGVFIAMKGPEGEEQEGARAAGVFGGRYDKSVGYTLPAGDGRTLVFWKKVSPTPAAYPRNGGKIAKKPL